LGEKSIVWIVRKKSDLFNGRSIPLLATGSVCFWSYVDFDKTYTQEEVYITTCRFWCPRF